MIAHKCIKHSHKTPHNTTYVFQNEKSIANRSQYKNYLRKKRHIVYINARLIWPSQTWELGHEISRSVIAIFSSYGPYDPYGSTNFFKRHKLALSPIEKLYSRSVNPFYEPYDPWDHFQFIGGSTNFLEQPPDHKLTLPPIDKLYSRSVNSSHEPYGSYEPFSVRTVRTIRTDRRIFLSFTWSQTDTFTDWKTVFTIHKSFSRTFSVRTVREAILFMNRRKCTDRECFTIFTIRIRLAVLDNHCKVHRNSFECTPYPDPISGPRNRVCDIKSGHDFCSYRNYIQAFYFQINAWNLNRG